MFLKKALFKTVTALNTPIVVSIASSGTPRPVQTAPVVVWNESVYGYIPESTSIVVLEQSSTRILFPALISAFNKEIVSLTKPC